MSILFKCIFLSFASSHQIFMWFITLRLFKIIPNWEIQLNFKINFLKAQGYVQDTVTSFGRLTFQELLIFYCLSNRAPYNITIFFTSWPVFRYRSVPFSQQIGLHIYIYSCCEVKIDEGDMLILYSDFTGEHL